MPGETIDLNASGVFEPDPEFNQVKMQAHNLSILMEVLNAEKEQVSLLYSLSHNFNAVCIDM